LSRRLLWPCGEEGSTQKEDKYKQPFDQQPRVFLKMLKIRIYCIKYD
jgi:hypothetical protein